MNYLTEKYSSIPLLTICLCILFTSCRESIETPIPELRQNLGDFIAANSDFQIVQDSIIACALGGEGVTFTDSEDPVSILFFPEDEPTLIQYFETESSSSDPSDLSNYWLQDLVLEPIFNGYLQKFKRQATGEELSGIVSYLRNGKIYLSRPISLKDSYQPTENNPTLVTIETPESLSPLFTWENGMTPSHEIFFHVIQDADGNLLSGTYSLDNQFQFYKLDNIVLNIRDVNPPPTLMPSEEYFFTLMGVSDDNWVNLVAQKSFIAE